MATIFCSENWNKENTIHQDRARTAAWETRIGFAFPYSNLMRKSSHNNAYATSAMTLHHQRNCHIALVNTRKNK